MMRRRSGQSCALPVAAALFVMATGPGRAEDRALVIGIDDYTTLAQPVVLASAAADAARFAAFLTGRAGFLSNEVTILTDADATSDAILWGITDRLLAETQPGERVVLYFAGLGTTTITASGAAVPALVAADGASALGLIPADLLDELFDLASDRQVTIVLDAGFGAVPPAGAPWRSLGATAGPVPDLAAFGAGDERVLWTAAGPAGPAVESASGGILTAFLLEGMGGIAEASGDQFVSNDELLVHATGRVAAFCATAIPVCDAVPTLTGDGTRPAFLSADMLPEPVVAEAVDIAPLSFDALLAFVTDLFGPTNPARLSIGIDADLPISIGSPVRFTASSGVAGALILLDIDTEGRLTQIFPSELAPSEGIVGAGQEVVFPAGTSANGLPLRVTVTGPAGRGILLALFTPGDPAALAALLPERLADGAIPDAGQYLYAIAQNLLQNDADPATRLDWSAAFLPYEIIP